MEAPVGFEPTVEGFAGPAIRPLWHSATYIIIYRSQSRILHL